MRRDRGRVSAPGPRGVPPEQRPADPALPHRDPVPATVLRGAQAALPRGRSAHGAAPHRGLRQGTGGRGARAVEPREKCHSVLIPSSVPPQVPGMKEILLMGFYQPNEALSRFLVSAQQEFKVPIRWAGTLSPLGHIQWHSLTQPLTCLPQAGSPRSALWHWAGGLCPTVDGHRLIPPLVLPPFFCLGSCPGWFLLQRCFSSTALSCHSLLLCNTCMTPITERQGYSLQSFPTLLPVGAIRHPLP